MALEKEITYSDGSTMGYHRIVSCSVVTNVGREVLVRSYQSASVRALEKKHESEQDGLNVAYRDATYSLEAGDGITVSDAYTALKQTELFDGATDATDDDDDPIQPTEPVMTVSDLADAVADLSESVSDNSTELSDAIAELAQLVSDIDEKVSNLNG